MQNHKIGKKKVCISHSGFKYEGGLINGKPNGYGVMTYANGTKYEGVWKDGILTGDVVCHFPNGHLYSGQIKNGKPHGRGIFFFASGNSYMGKWRNGRLMAKEPWYSLAS